MPFFRSQGELPSLVKELVIGSISGFRNPMHPDTGRELVVGVTRHDTIIPPAAQLRFAKNHSATIVEIDGGHLFPLEDNWREEAEKLFAALE